MPRLSAGSTMPDFTYQTAFKDGQKLSDAVRRVPGRTVLQFLRYYGCRMCQLDIITFKEEHDKIRAAGGQLIVVLQSDPKKMNDWTADRDLPFEIICDPEQSLYKQFEIAPAKSKEEMSGPRADAKRARFDELGLVHGEYEGEELQLPATFVLDHDMHVRYARYGTSVDDVPTPDEMVTLMGRLIPGDLVDDVTVDTPFEHGLKLSALLARAKGPTAIQFLRYWGCTLCQLDISVYAEEHPAMAASGGQLLVVLQSDPKKLASTIQRDSLPFDIICDPDQHLYKKLGIIPAVAKEKMLGPDTMAKIDKAHARGLKHGDYEGEELQLPASLILDRDRKVKCVHYGRSVDDIMTIEDFVKGFDM